MTAFTPYYDSHWPTNRKAELNSGFSGFFAFWYYFVNVNPAVTNCNFIIYKRHSRKNEMLRRESLAEHVRVLVCVLKTREQDIGLFLKEKPWPVCVDLMFTYVGTVILDRQIIF